MMKNTKLRYLLLTLILITNNILANQSEELLTPLGIVAPRIIFETNFANDADYYISHTTYKSGNVVPKGFDSAFAGGSGGSIQGMAGAGSTTNDMTSVTSSVSGGQSELLTIGNLLSYKGAFRLSSGTFGISSVNYAIGTLAYNPDNHSIFIAGHSHHRAIAEFTVPELINGATLFDLNEVQTPLQNFMAPLNANNNPENIDRITGMLYVGGQLIINAEDSYDASASNTNTTLVIRDAGNIATSTIDGYYELSGGAQAGGYLSPIPQEWQAAFGVAYLTGWSSVYSIVSRYSVGPSLWTFDHATLLDDDAADSGPINATALLNYPHQGGHYIHPDALKRTTGSSSPLWNYLSRGVFGFIVPGTNTFAVFGSAGGIYSGVGYKITQDNGNTCGGYCAYDSDDYYNYYWLYNVQDILNATNVYDPQPYEYGKLSVPFDEEGSHSIKGGAFDPATGTLYLSLSKADRENGARAPVIVGYQVVSGVMTDLIFIDGFE